MINIKFFQNSILRKCVEMEKLSWWQLSSIQIGGAICIPLLLAGQTLNQSYGFESAIISIFIGNTILLFLGLITAKMSFEERKTTIENAEKYFGKVGVHFLALILASSLLGWFAIQLNMMSWSIIDLFFLDSSDSLFRIGLNTTLGLLITIAAFYGIKSLNALANCTVPLLLATLFYALFTLEKEPSTVDHEFSIRGVSIVVGLIIVGVIDFPTYYRHTKSLKDSYISIFLIFGFVLPCLEIIGVYLASNATGESFLNVLKGNHGNLWNIWIAFFLIFAGWTTNNLNIYSGSVYLNYSVKNLSHMQSTLYFGLLGTLCASVNLLDHFESVLRVISVFIGSMGAVVITRYFLNQIQNKSLYLENQLSNLIAWVLGIIVGVISIAGMSITSIAVLDAALSSSFAVLLIQSTTKKVAYESN